MGDVEVELFGRNSNGHKLGLKYMDINTKVMAVYRLDELKEKILNQLKKRNWNNE